MHRRQKNVLIVVHHYPPHITGVGTVAQNHAKWLAAQGHKVTVITSRTNSEEKSFSADGVDVIRVGSFNFTEKWAAPFPLFSPMLIPQLIKHIKNADIVHIHDAFYISSFWTALIAHVYKKPIVLTQHVSMIAHPNNFIVLMQKIVYRTTGAMIFNYSDLILTYNDSVEQFLIARGVNKNKLAVMVNGVDTDLFHRVTEEEKDTLRKKFGIDPIKKAVLFVGRHVPKKGLDKVLAARSSEYTIVCAGGETPKEPYEGVVFLGKLDKRTLAEAYRASDIFILPSESEGFPLSIQEAMASGLPIITTNDPGYKQYGLDEKTIHFLDDLSEASVKKAIDEMVHNDKRLNEMAVFSEYHAKEHFSWSIVVKELDKRYDRLILEKNPKRSISIVSDAVYPFNKGGKEKRMYDISTRLAADGYDVTIYCMKWWKEKDKVIIQNGVRLYAISPYYPLYSGSRRSIKQAIFFSLECLKLIGKKIDVIDVDHMPHLILYTLKIVCFIKGKKMIATWHEVWGREYWKKYLGTFLGEIAFIVEKISARLPNVILSVSDQTTEKLQSVLNTNRKIITIPNGVNINHIIKRSLDGNTYDIIFAGRLLTHKNVDILLRAVVLLKKNKPDISVCIVGEGPERENLEHLANDLGISKNISFLGFLDDERALYSMMQSSKVFVLPSTREGFGITVIEANSSGLPVITIDDEHNAARDLIIKNENGLLSTLDERNLADTIAKMLQTRKDPEFYMKYAEKYSWDSIVPRIEEVYTMK